MENVDEFYAETPKKEISLTEMNQLVCSYVDARTVVKEMEDAVKLAKERENQLKGQLLQNLEEAGLKNFAVPGVGKVLKVESLTYTTPKSLPDKEALFGFIEERYGHDGYLSYVSVNSQTLNSLAKKLVEEGVPNIPGLALPQSIVTLRFNKE